jgi:hypothetical protein
MDLLQTLQPFGLFRNKGLVGKPTPKVFLFMKGIHKEAGRLRGGDLQPQLFQGRVLAQQLKIVETISTGGKNGDKRFHIICFFILAGAFLERKMFLDGLGKTQGSISFHDQGKTAKGGHENVGRIFNELEGKKPLCYIHSAPPG